MPYLADKNRREALDPTGDGVPRDPGELNYAITALMREYLLARDALSYAAIAETLAGCREAEEEFRRRVLAPYENEKRSAHGDVYPRRLVGDPDERARRAPGRLP